MAIKIQLSGQGLRSVLGLFSFIVDSDRSKDEITVCMMAETTTITLPKTETVTATEDGWNVVVLNDPVNLMGYVVFVLRRVFGYNEAKASKMMLEVHHEGRSVVWTGEREPAENYVYTLQQWQLNTILERNGQD